MNERLRDLMIRAGYAAPEIAVRAQRLAELITQDCSEIVRDVYRAEGSELGVAELHELQSRIQSLGQ
jgi:hypothetical protein